MPANARFWSKKKKVASDKTKQSQGIAVFEIIFSQKNDIRFDRNYDKMAVSLTGRLVE
jgi:hypothetical protein